MFELLPPDWKSQPVKELAQVVSGGTPSRNVAAFWEKGNIPWVTPTDITSASGKYISDSADHITQFGLQSSAATLLPAGSILMTSRATLGESRISTVPACTNQGFKSLVTKPGVSSEFLYYQMLLNKEQYAQFGSGSTFLEVGKKDTERFPVAVGPYDQQRKIAEILSTIDFQIEATEALIAKQERVRAGLLQDLFTCGVDEHGGLRSPREEAPQLYQATELGWLPRGWDAPRLECLLAPISTPMRSGPFGSALLKHELVGSGVPFLGIDNIHVERFNAEFIRFVTPQKFSELFRYRVLPDDVVITIMGTVGRCCVIPYGFDDLLSSKHIWAMTFDRLKVIPDLVCWQLNNAPWVLSWFRKKSQGGIMDAIQSSTLRDLRLPTPHIWEQERILAIYAEAKGRLCHLRDEAAKLALLKSALMQDLLTARVSVAPLLESEPA